MNAAAGELSVTHGAISRHIKTLEGVFGIPLLLRCARSVQATSLGGRLATELSRAFDLIASSVEQLQPGPLTLSCSSTIKMSWLIPRIGAFHELHPDIELRFNMNYDRIDFVRDEISVAIRNSMIDPPKEVIIKDMINEWIGPVCSPEYASKHLESKHLGATGELDRCVLLATKTRPGGWADWARTTAQSGEFRPRRFYDHFYQLIQAAACGLCVAMVPKILVLDDLRSGKLLAPLGFVPGPFNIVLWIAPHLRVRSETKALVEWLTQEFRKPGMQGEANELLPMNSLLKVSRR
jgi:LysR family transcriptional regulator, glycine cleavage system transcriptional activator